MGESWDILKWAVVVSSTFFAVFAVWHRRVEAHWKDERDAALMRALKVAEEARMLAEKTHRLRHNFEHAPVFFTGGGASYVRAIDVIRSDAGRREIARQTGANPRTPKANERKALDPASKQNPRAPRPYRPGDWMLED